MMESTLFTEKMKLENPQSIPLSAACSLELNGKEAELPEMISTPVSSHGKIAEPMKARSGWNIRNTSTGLNGLSRKTKKSLR